MSASVAPIAQGNDPEEILDSNAPNIQKTKTMKRSSLRNLSWRLGRTYQNLYNAVENSLDDEKTKS